MGPKTFKRELPRVNVPVVYERLWSEGTKVGHPPRFMGVATFNVPGDARGVQGASLRVMFIQNRDIVFVDCRAPA